MSWWIWALIVLVVLIVGGGFALVRRDLARYLRIRSM